MGKQNIFAILFVFLMNWATLGGLAENRVAIDTTLLPGVRSQLAALENGSEYQALVCDWISRAAAPGVTNEANYFAAWKRAEGACGTLEAATNLAAQIKGLPPLLKLSLVYGHDLAPAIPGVDYPGVVPEDAGSTPAHIRLALCAPKDERHFRVTATVVNAGRAQYEFKWMILNGIGNVTQNWSDAPSTSTQRISVHSFHVNKTRTFRVAVFARSRPGFWGPPALIEVTPPPFGVRRYDKGLVYSIDYGAFRDVYSYGEKNIQLGFERFQPGMFRGEPYSNLGERIIESYSDFCPRTTHKVVYSVKDGKLTYTESDELIEHDNAIPQNRARKW